jgi:hypothetical protein
VPLQTILKALKCTYKPPRSACLSILSHPKKTQKRFEIYLPYAIALGVENSRTEKFEVQKEKAIAEGYRPGYYSTKMRSGNYLIMKSISRSISPGL